MQATCGTIEAGKRGVFRPAPSSQRRTRKLGRQNILMRLRGVENASSARTWVQPACVATVAACVLVSGILAPSGLLQAQTAVTLKVMDWNIHHGLDTANTSNLDRVTTWIKDIGAQVVSLNEVEKQNGYTNNADQPAVLESQLESKTGVPWYGCFAQRIGSAAGQGNLILSRIRIDSCGAHLLSAQRSVARATISLNGAAISFFSTHLDDASAAMRIVQVGELSAWATPVAEQRIAMGDFNASATATELQLLRDAWDDTWAVAAAAGTAVTYPGNTAGNTRNGRIDYIWRSKRATRLVLQGAQVYNTGSISDHRPVSATYLVTPTSTTTTLQPPGNLRVVGSR
jgi:endonuclease/exonuclease/phosphatase family metal-dependent hydrolase